MRTSSRRRVTPVASRWLRNGTANLRDVPHAFAHLGDGDAVGRVGQQPRHDPRRVVHGGGREEHAVDLDDPATPHQLTKLATVDTGRVRR